MKKVLFLSILAASFITLASFTKHSTAKSLPATPFNVQTTIDVTGIVLYDPCTGEALDLSGSLHLDAHGVVNNNKATYVYHANNQGVSAVGETSGNTYRFTYSTNEKDDYSVDGTTLTIHYTENWNFVTAGGGNNYFLKYRVTLLIDLVNNTVTVVREKLDEGCR